MKATKEDLVRRIGSLAGQELLSLAKADLRDLDRLLAVLQRLNEKREAKYDARSKNISPGG
jgi:hypothetical protein